MILKLEKADGSYLYMDNVSNVTVVRNTEVPKVDPFSENTNTYIVKATKETLIDKYEDCPDSIWRNLEGKLSIFNSVIFHVNKENHTFIFNTNAYLMNDSGKTIERIGN